MMHVDGATHHLPCLWTGPFDLPLTCAAYCHAHDPDEGGMEMPKVSSDSASQRQEAGPVVDLRDDLDGYTVSFTSLLEDIDATPFMKGLPDDAASARIGAMS